MEESCLLVRVSKDEFIIAMEQDSATGVEMFKIHFKRGLLTATVDKESYSAFWDAHFLRNDFPSKRIVSCSFAQTMQKHIQTFYDARNRNPTKPVVMNDEQGLFGSLESFWTKWVQPKEILDS